MSENLNMNKPKLMILLWGVLATSFCQAQIGGISASKVAAFCVDPIDNHEVEFEPSYGIQTSHSYWNEDGKEQDLYDSTDSVELSSGLMWRISYGLLDDKMEVGISFSPDLSSFNWGAKMTVWQQEKTAISLMAGLFTPMGSRVFDRSAPSPDDVSSYGLGIINSWIFSESFSLDVNIQYQDYFQQADGLSEWDYFFNAEVGKYIMDNQLLLIGGFGYQQYNFQEGNQQKWTFYPGVSIEFAENFLVVFNGAFDFTGKNISRTNGFGMALTTFLK